MPQKSALEQAKSLFRRLTGVPILLSDPRLQEMQTLIDAGDLAGAAEIQSIPTLMVFRDGIMLFRQAGVLPAASLEDLVTQVQALDMDEVRAQVAANAAAPDAPSAG